MGTRADFYVGRGKGAEWLGSVAFDGYPDNDAYSDIFDADDEDDYRAAVRKLRKRDDWTSPKDGWPWPWEDSRTTDCAYAWDGGMVWVTWFGRVWRPVQLEIAVRKLEHAANEVLGQLENQTGLDDLRRAADALVDFPLHDSNTREEFPDMTDVQNVTYGHRSGALFLGLKR